jgi:hypothetical protein
VVVKTVATQRLIYWSNCFRNSSLQIIVYFSGVDYHILFISIVYFKDW